MGVSKPLYRECECSKCIFNLHIRGHNTNQPMFLTTADTCLLRGVYGGVAKITPERQYTFGTGSVSLTVQSIQRPLPYVRNKVPSWSHEKEYTKIIINENDDADLPP
jgi:hypothetical protein